jgi:hypothetical protein
MIEEFFTSGHVVYLILAVMLIEGVVLARFLCRIPAMFWGLCAGGCMVLALWAALMERGAMMIGLFLALSFACHLLEVRQWLNLAKRLPQ